jgi:hypothetical protein
MILVQNQPAGIPAIIMIVRIIKLKMSFDKVGSPNNSSVNNRNNGYHTKHAILNKARIIRIVPMPRIMPTSGNQFMDWKLIFS